MEERNIDIEKWLQQAATRQEQEQTAPAEKQEAWDAMRGMLDHPPIPPRHFRWRFWLGGALLLGVVIYFVLPGAEDKKSVSENQTVDEVRANEGIVPDDKNEKDVEYTGKEKTNEEVVQDDRKEQEAAEAGKDNLKMNKGIVGDDKKEKEAEHVGKKNLKKNEGIVRDDRQQKEVVEAGKDNLKMNEGIVRDDREEKEVASGGNGKLKASENKVTADKRDAADAGKNFLKLDEKEGTDKGEVNSKTSKPVPGNNTGPGRTGPSSKHTRETAATGGIAKSDAAQSGRANPALPRTVAPPSAQTGPWQISVLPRSNTSGIALRPAAPPPRPTTGPDVTLSRSPSGILYKPVTRNTKGYAASGFSIRVGGILPVDNAYGANVAAEYTFSFFNRLRLRPYAGATYLAGFNKPYQHTALYARPVGPGTGTGRVFMIDSIVTTYQATSLWLGEGGLQAAYAHKRWELMAGIGYQRVFKANGTEDTTFKTRRDSLHAPNYQPELFSKRKLPGVGKLILQAGIDYMITPQLQGGVRYTLQLRASEGGRGYNFNPQSGGPGGTGSGYRLALPLQSSLEVQVRWYFRKKKESFYPTN